LGIGNGNSDAIRKIVEAAYRRARRVLATLIRLLGSFDWRKSDAQRIRGRD
jgi:hypothetical protein